MISKLDFVSVPSQDAERSKAFYVDTLGLRPDGKAPGDSGLARRAALFLGAPPVRHGIRPAEERPPGVTRG